MPTIRVETHIVAAPERCFDLARSVEAHQDSLSDTNERAVAGVTTGLLGLGDTVTWEASHFGITQRLTARITAYDRPTQFVDEMVNGVFHSFAHTHEFVANDEGTRMTDTFQYVAPLGVLGRLADVLFLERYMRRLLTVRGQGLKARAEALSRAK